MYLKKGFSIAGIIAISCLIGGCSGGYEAITCQDLRQEVVEMTEEEKNSLGFALVKIYDPTEVSRTASRVTCRGIGSFTDGDEVEIEYEVYKDREGEWMLKFSEI